MPNDDTQELHSSESKIHRDHYELQIARPAFMRKTLKERPSVFNNGRSSVGGIVRDVFESGASVAFVSSHGIPDQARMLLDDGYACYSCRATQRELQELRLVFLEP